MAEADRLSTERRRGRPSPARAAAIERLIRDAALELFLEAGYDAANMDEVAARAGISKGTLYTRFDSKEELFRTVVEAQASRVSDYTTRGLATLPLDLEHRLRFHAHAVHAAFRSEEFRRLDRLVILARASFPDLAGLMQSFLKTNHGELLAEAFAEAASSGGQAGIDWAFVSSLLINGISGWFLNESQFRVVSEAEGARFCDNLVDLILAAAGKPA